MKKLVCAAIVAASMCAMADEAKKDAAPAVAPAAAVAKPAVPARPKMTDEQRALMRERREKFIAERKAAMEAKLLEVVKKYVPEEDKAKALVKDLQAAMMSARRPMMNRPMPKAAAPAPAAK